MPEVEGYTISAEAFTRIKDAVLAVEAKPWNTAPMRPGFRPFAPNEAHLIKTTGTITARSGTTLGSGPANIWSNVDSVLTDTGIDITVYNIYDASIASGRYLPVTRDPISGEMTVSSQIWQAGCGLTLTADSLAFNASYVAGLGLEAQSDCKLGVKYVNCPIKDNGTGSPTIDLGCGMKLDACKLTLDLGCGLECVANQVRVKNTDLDGDWTLSTIGTCGLRVNVGCNLKQHPINSNLIVDTAALTETYAGWSCLEPASNECAITVKVDVGWGLSKNATGLRVVRADLLGSGLAAGGGNVQMVVDVDNTSVELVGGKVAVKATGSSATYRIDKLTTGIITFLGGQVPVNNGDFAWGGGNKILFRAGGVERNVPSFGTVVSTGDVVWNMVSDKPEVLAVTVTGGTQLTLGAIADGQYVKRTGTVLEGATVTAYSGPDSALLWGLLHAACGGL